MVTKNDWSFYNKKIQEWQAMAEQYLEYGDMGGFNRCLARAEEATWLRDECAGLIIVYTGRPHARYGWPMATHS